MALIRMTPAELGRILDLWREDDLPLPQQLASALIERIEAGFIPPGICLPSQRELSRTLAVSRGTVVSAYGILEGQGYLVSKIGSGSRVRSRVGRIARRNDGRLFSFTSAPKDVIDLSTGALPASPIATQILTEGIGAELHPYLETDGYFPAGLPLLRQSIADHLSRDGVPTRPQEILVTSGAQHATTLALGLLIGAAELALVEEPTYRGGIETLKAISARIEGLRMVNGSLDVNQVAKALTRKPSLLYCQTSIHNPTGQSLAHPDRLALAQTINTAGLTTVEDCCSYDLTLTGRPAPTLAGLVEPTLLVSVYTMSKLFWGGLRVGWIRSDASRIRMLTEWRKATDLASPVIDQLLAVQMLRHADLARRERAEMLTSHLAETERSLQEVFPEWTWDRIIGGSGLWINTGMDAPTLAEIGKQVLVKLAPGPGFSIYGGQRTRLRLPIWHESQQLTEGLVRVAKRLEKRT